MNEQQQREIQRNFEELNNILSRNQFREEISFMIRELISDLELDLIDSSSSSNYIGSSFDASEILKFTENLKSFLREDLSSPNMTAEKVADLFPQFECGCATTPSCPPARRVNSFIESVASLYSL